MIRSRQSKAVSESMSRFRARYATASRRMDVKTASSPRLPISDRPVMVVPCFALPKINGPDLEQPVFFRMDLQVDDDPVAQVLVQGHGEVPRFETPKTAPSASTLIRTSDFMCMKTLELFLLSGQ
jgi:hypothetical protein